MLSMRVEHAAGLEDLARVRPRMADLAARFPGALREIDDLELGEIQRRIARLDAFLDASGHEEAWMKPMALFHRLARGALAAKRWLGGRKQVDGALLSSFVREALASPLSEEIHAWVGDLASVASPPRGRVMNLVFARLARELGVTEDAARRLVFGLPTRD
jgi:hypothetical protein